MYRNRCSTIFERMSYPYNAKALRVRLQLIFCRVRFLKFTGVDNSNSKAQMDIIILFRYGLRCVMVVWSLIQIHRQLKERRQQRLKQRQDIENQPRTQQDILNEYKNNPGHRSLTRSERRFRERQLEKHLERTWNVERSRSDRPRPRARTVRKDPAINKGPGPVVSRMNRQLKQQPRLEISHISLSLSPHLLLQKLFIFTALTFLAFCIFCQSLRTNLTESYYYSLEFDEEEEEVEEEGEYSSLV